MRPIIIADHNAAWAARFEAERVLLTRVFEGAVVDIEHVGSTAVPGLAAKPIVDIMLGAQTLDVVEARIPALEANGYEYVDIYEDVMPERRYFRKNDNGVRSVHLHSVVTDDAFWRRHLHFRDYLRANPEAAAEYQSLKRGLAEKHRMDPEAYMDGKSAFIQAIERKAAEQAR